MLAGFANAYAAPGHCSYGYQDSSCITPQYRAPEPPPGCSTDAGWTTLTSAKWMGSGYTQPACHYDAPPTCRAGFTQTSDPVWNGSSWSAPECTPDRLPENPVSTSDELAACIAKARTAALYPVVNLAYTFGPFPSVGWSAFLQPRVWSSGSLANEDTMPNIYAGVGSFDPPQVENDMFVVGGGLDFFRQSTNICFVQRGTTNIIGFYNLQNSHVNNNDITPNPPPGTGFSLRPRDRWYNPSGSYVGLYYQGSSGTLMK
jgi:hypothetical protein